MRHYYLNGNSTSMAHYGVSLSSDLKRLPCKILLQVNDGHDEVRIALTPNQARHIINLLKDQIKKFDIFNK